jgi:hypothetical protein
VEASVVPASGGSVAAGGLTGGGPEAHGAVVSTAGEGFAGRVERHLTHCAFVARQHLMQLPARHGPEPHGAVARGRCQVALVWGEGQSPDGAGMALQRAQRGGVAHVGPLARCNMHDAW